MHVIVYSRKRKLLGGLQVGNIATNVLLYLIWCANEVLIGLNFLLFIIKLFTIGIQHFFHWNYQKWSNLR